MQSATIAYNENDIRFTTSKDGKTLYVFALGIPKANTDIPLQHIFDAAPTASVKQVSLVSNNTPVEWSKNDDQTLTITTPEGPKMNEIATVFRVELE